MNRLNEKIKENMVGTEGRQHFLKVLHICPLSCGKSFNLLICGRHCEKAHPFDIIKFVINNERGAL
jgi:hypothetical protein